MNNSSSSHGKSKHHVAATPAKGILKKPANKYDRKNLSWDVKNLADNEENRTATQKIDEPKTPYIYYDMDSDKAMEEDLNEFRLDCDQSPISSMSKLAEKSASKLSFAWESSDDELIKPVSEHESSKDFIKHRTDHYGNMKEAMKMGKEKISSEDES